MKKVFGLYAWYILMPFAWIAIFAAFLYSPRIGDFFAGPKRALTIFVWSDIIDQELVQQFEKRTGVKVHISYYTGNDELLAKLQFSGGLGYDIVMPTHYVVPSLIERGFLAPIDQKKCTFWHDLNEHFLNKEHDPANTYTIPFVWEIYGLGINELFFKDKKLPESWQALFRPTGYRVGMTDEPREIVHLAADYLFGSQYHTLTPTQQYVVAQLLIKQKKFVEAYTDLNMGSLLASGACPVVLLSNSLMYRFKKETPNLDFILPLEGTVVSLENLAIASHSTNKELAYEFINFLFEHETLHKIYQQYGYLPARADTLKVIDLGYLAPHEKLERYLKKTSLIKILMPRQELYKLWLSVKAY